MNKNCTGDPIPASTEVGRTETACQGTQNKIPFVKSRTI